jgi:ABC-type lipoprotein export system ATPase subunit
MDEVKEETDTEAMVSSTNEDEKPLELSLKLRIPKGSFIAIVGPVGSGKVTSA